jgi:hypothetical protein
MLSFVVALSLLLLVITIGNNFVFIAFVVVGVHVGLLDACYAF